MKIVCVLLLAGVCISANGNGILLPFFVAMAEELPPAPSHAPETYSPDIATDFRGHERFIVHNGPGYVNPGLVKARSGMSILVKRWKEQPPTPEELVQASQFIEAAANLERHGTLADFDLYVARHKQEMRGRMSPKALGHLIRKGSYNLLIEQAEAYKAAAAAAQGMGHPRLLPVSFGNAYDCRTWELAGAADLAIGAALNLAGGPETPWAIMGDTFGLVGAGLFLMHTMFCAN